MSRRQYVIIVLCLVLIAALAMMGFGLSRLPTLSRMTIGRITSYYVYSGVEGDHDSKLPVIIFVGHPADSPRRLLQFKDKFDEPVLLIWSGLLRNFSRDTPIEDETVWATKRQEFIEEFNHYRAKFNIDSNRVYLTGFSASGVYAWMLAYDQPESYTAVAAMSSVSYPPQIQEHLSAGKRVITVVVRGRQDFMFPKHLEQEMQTGRIIESYNPCSKFILKEGEGHGDVAQHWLEYLKYTLKFRKTDAVLRDSTIQYKTSGEWGRSHNPPILGLAGPTVGFAFCLWRFPFYFSSLLFPATAGRTRI